MKYRTVAGDRWDMISYRFYGDSDRYKDIIKANPYLPEEIKRASILPEGIVLEIPDIEIKPAKPEELPPWKR
ncbi:MAG TPA: tail protein X [Candidatus Hydrothermia bacterium]|nr:tail protein X [Candidatus Hydrothermia bacterium]